MRRNSYRFAALRQTKFTVGELTLVPTANTTENSASSMTITKESSPKAGPRRSGKPGSYGATLPAGTVHRSPFQRVASAGSSKELLQRSRSKYTVWEEKDLEERRGQKMEEEMRLERYGLSTGPRPPWMFAVENNLGTGDGGTAVSMLNTDPGGGAGTGAGAHDRLPLRMSRVDQFNTGIGGVSPQRRVSFYGGSISAECKSVGAWRIKWLLWWSW